MMEQHVERRCFFVGTEHSIERCIFTCTHVGMRVMYVAGGSCPGWRARMQKYNWGRGRCWRRPRPGRGNIGLLNNFWQLPGNRLGSTLPSVVEEKEQHFPWTYCRLCRLSQNFFFLIYILTCIVSVCTSVYMEGTLPQERGRRPIKKVWSRRK